MSRMEVWYKPSPTLSFKLECNGMEDMFKSLGPLQEVIGNNSACGRCGGRHIRFSHRKTADGNHDVYELYCETPNDKGIPCNSRLALGKAVSGELFPRRYEQEKGADGKWVPKVDGDGKRVWLPNNGWVRWDSKTESYV